MSDKSDMYDSLGFAAIIVAIALAVVLWGYAKKLEAEASAIEQKTENTKPGYPERKE